VAYRSVLAGITGRRGRLPTSYAESAIGNSHFGPFLH
jgi:hypothetical protein